jgi:hypothetical protein
LNGSPDEGWYLLIIKKFFVNRKIVWSFLNVKTYVPFPGRHFCGGRNPVFSLSLLMQRKYIISLNVWIPVYLRHRLNITYPDEITLNRVSKAAQDILKRLEDYSTHKK